jgi:hypothetical protein
MADGTIDVLKFYLKMGRFGPPTVRPKQLLGGIAGGLHHNVATAYFKPGSVVVLTNPTEVGSPGQAEFVYLQFVANAAVAIAVKVGLAPDSATDRWVYTNDPDDSVGAVVPTGNGFGVFAIGTMTTTYYGWAWSGGVVPTELVAGMTGNFATDSDVSAGDPLILNNLAADALGLGPLDTAGQTAIGFALDADS